jgi:hypothetical protein
MHLVSLLNDVGTLSRRLPGGSLRTCACASRIHLSVCAYVPVSTVVLGLVLGLFCAGAALSGGAICRSEQGALQHCPWAACSACSHPFWSCICMCILCPGRHSVPAPGVHVQCLLLPKLSVVTLDPGQVWVQSGRRFWCCQDCLMSFTGALGCMRGNFQYACMLAWA